MSLTDGYVPPFQSDEMSLSDVLSHAVEHNPSVAIANVDVEISEARIMAALGAFDLSLTANLGGEVTEFPQRGSQLAVSLGQRTIGGGVGFERKIETGGTVGVTVDTFRTRADQPANILDPTAGQTRLTAYSVVPTLRVQHSLLRGMGLKVNRAPIERAKVAKTVSQAQAQVQAQTVARDIIVAYWDVLRSHQDLINKRRNVDLAQQQQRITDGLVAAGRRSKMDAKVARQGVVKREAQVLEAEQTLLRASLRLRTLMGDDVGRADHLGVIPTTDPVVEVRSVIIKDEIDQALERNPEVRRVELLQGVAEIDEQVAKNNKRPQLDFEGRFTPQGRSIDRLPDPTTGAPGQDASWGGAFGNIFNEDVGADGALADWTLTGTVTLTWDVRNRKAKGAHEEALLAVRRSELTIDDMRRQVTSRVVEAASVLRTAGKMIDVAELSYELAQDNLVAEQARFKVGRATNYDVLLRLDEVDNAATEALDARIAYLKALADLQTLNGELLPAYGLEG